MSFFILSGLSGIALYSMSHLRGQRVPGSPGKDAAAASSSSPSRKKAEYMTGVMPPGIQTKIFRMLLIFAVH
jgi:hypothetical protein